MNGTVGYTHFTHTNSSEVRPRQPLEVPGMRLTGHNPNNSFFIAFLKRQAGRYLDKTNNQLINAILRGTLHLVCL